MAKQDQGRGGETIKGINQDVLFEFFTEEKIASVVKQVYDIALNDPDSKNRLTACRDILDRIMGKPPIRQEIKTEPSELQGIFIGNLKGEPENSPL